AVAAGLRPIIGAEFTIGGAGQAGRAGGAGGAGQAGGASGAGRSESTSVENARSTYPPHLPHQPYPPLIVPVLCESQEGYRNLCRLVTRMKMRAPKGEGALTLDELDGSTNGLVALAGRAVLNGQRYGVGGLLDRLVGVFGRANVYVELQR